jgi:DNA-binding Lrp family transcriptional regulator
VIVVAQQHSLNYFVEADAKQGELRYDMCSDLSKYRVRCIQEKVIESLKNIEGAEEAHSLYGVYDRLININANSIDKLKDTVKSRIKQVAGVTSSLTLITVEH